MVKMIRARIMRMPGRVRWSQSYRSGNALNGMPVWHCIFRQGAGVGKRVHKFKPKWRPFLLIIHVRLEFCLCFFKVALKTD